MNTTIKVYTNKTNLIALNHTKALITIDVHLEPELPRIGDDFDFGDELENRRYLTRFESGELIYAYLIVKASACGCTGSDSIGAVHLKASDLESDVMNTIAEHDMKNTACADLIETMKGVKSALDKAFKGVML